MKKFLKYTLIGLVGAISLNSCSGDLLDTNPTDSVSGSTLMADATNALIPLNGIYRSMYTSGWSTADPQHECFGVSSCILTAEVMGEDCIIAAEGNGWFWYDCLYNVKTRFTSANWRSYDLWNSYFTWVANANYIIAAEETMEGDKKDVNNIVGQAYAIRAYSYFMLEQWFARTIVGHENEPGVPIYTGPTFTTTTGQPRATNAEVYAQIESDINKACELLKGTTAAHKSHISYATAQGLKSRIYMVEEKWAEAAAAAEEAIATSGASILEVKDFIGVNDVKKANVMWGAEIITDQTGKYASFFCHMSNKKAYGKDSPKLMSSDLYSHMGDADARLAWADPSNGSGNLDAGAYVQTKFDYTDITTWMGDYVWMRVEEMYLNAAEAYCHLGNDVKAKEYLMALMEKRDPNYSCNNLSGKALSKLTSEHVRGSLLEEIIMQRRIELWGEAGRIHDIRRLHQGFRRTADQGWPSVTLLNNRPTDDPESYMWVLTIPQAEFDGNINMDAAKDQNPTGDK